MSDVSPADEKTLVFYGENARAYAEREIAKHTRLKAFLARLPAGASILAIVAVLGVTPPGVDEQAMPHAHHHSH